MFSSPSSVPQRGGVHVELGVALAWKKPVHLVGHRTHFFHHLPQVRYHREWYGPTGLRTLLARAAHPVGGE